METSLAVVALVALVSVVALAAIAMTLRRCVVQVPSGHAVVVHGPGGRTRVAFSTAVVAPWVAHYEPVDLTVRTVSVRCEDRAGIVCKDNLRASMELQATFRIPADEHSVLHVVQKVGARAASDPQTLRTLFEARLVEALKTVAKQLDFEQILSQRDRFRDDVWQVLGADLSGYHLEDLCIPVVEQVPLEHLDPENILDAQAIRTITQITSAQAIAKNEHEIAVKKRLAQLQLEVDELVMEAARRRGAFLAEVMGDGGRVDVAALEAKLDERVQQIMALVRAS